MFDGNFRGSVDKVTTPIGRGLARLGVSADGLTVVGVTISAGAAIAIGSGRLWLGLGLVIASALPDLFDGAVAKVSGTQSIRGAFFDSVADRISDSLVLGGVAWYLIDIYGGRIALLPFAVLGISQLLSYMRAKAEISGFDAKGGIMERAERVVALCIGLAFSHLLVAVLWVMLALTILTALQRFGKVWHQATNESPVLVARREELRRWTRRWHLGSAEADEADERKRRSWREWAAQQRQHRRHMRRTPR